MQKNWSSHPTLSTYSLDDLTLARAGLLKAESRLLGATPISNALGIPKTIIRKMVQDLAHAQNVLIESYDIKNTIQTHITTQGYTPQKEEGTLRSFTNWLRVRPIYGLPLLESQIRSAKIKRLLSQDKSKTAPFIDMLNDMRSRTLDNVYTDRAYMTTYTDARNVVHPMVYFSSNITLRMLQGSHPTEEITGMIAEEISHHLLMLTHIFKHGEHVMLFFCEMLQAIDRVKCYEARWRAQEDTAIDNSFAMYQGALQRHASAINYDVQNVDQLLPKLDTQDTVYVPAHIFGTYYLVFIQTLYQKDPEEGKAFEKKFYYASNKDKLSMLLEEVPAYIKNHEIPVSWPAEMIDGTLLWYLPMGARWAGVIDDFFDEAGMEKPDHASALEIDGQRYRKSLDVFKQKYNLPNNATADLPKFFGIPYKADVIGYE